MYYCCQIKNYKADHIKKQIERGRERERERERERGREREREGGMEVII